MKLLRGESLEDRLNGLGGPCPCRSCCASAARWPRGSRQRTGTVLSPPFEVRDFPRLHEVGKCGLPTQGRLAPGGSAFIS
jgi:hypothetical protein